MSCKVCRIKWPFHNFKTLSCHLPGRTEETHEKRQSGYPLTGSRFETGTSRIITRSANHPAVTFNALRNDAENVF
jgi:hypothetical protein